MPIGEETLNGFAKPRDMIPRLFVRQITSWGDTKMWTDPIVDEVRAEAKKWSEQFAGDVHAMFAELRRLEQLSSEQFVTLPPRRPPSDAAVIAPLPSTSNVDNPQQLN